MTNFIHQILFQKAITHLISHRKIKKRVSLYLYLRTEDHLLNLNKLKNLIKPVQNSSPVILNHL